MMVKTISAKDVVSDNGAFQVLYRCASKIPRDIWYDAVERQLKVVPTWHMFEERHIYRVCNTTEIRNRASATLLSNIINAFDCGAEYGKE